jgi:hypothetical protein
MLRRHRSIRGKLMAILLLTSGAAVALTALSYCAYEFLTFRRAMPAQLAVLGAVIGII